MTDPEDAKASGTSIPRPKPAFDFDQVKAIVQRFFKVYESESDLGAAGSEIAAFYVQADPQQFSMKFEDLRESIRQLDPSLMVILQYRGGEDIILVARKPPVMARGNGLNLFLFLATILTTTLAGSIFYSGYQPPAEPFTPWGDMDVSYIHPTFLALGFLTFSLPVMLILGIHELGHYFVAKRHHVRTSLPFFIPVPPIVPIGTFGAFISIREPIPDRKALFDIGSAGPIAGFIASLPILVIGLLLTGSVAAPVPLNEELHATLTAPDGTTWSFDAPGANVNITVDEPNRGDNTHDERFFVNGTNLTMDGPWSFRIHGVAIKKTYEAAIRITYPAPADATPAAPFEKRDGNFTAELTQPVVPDGGPAEFRFNVTSGPAFLVAEFSWKPPPSPVAILGTSLLFEGFAYIIPTPDDVLIHPTGFAGWVGLLVTGFNLLPAGQLDGGHVARAVLGDKMKWASWASVAGMLALSYWFAGWLIMAILILFLGIQHPPPLNDRVALDAKRMFLAFLVLVILVVSFIPVPFAS